MIITRNETGAITTDTAEIQRIIRKCYQLLGTRTFDNSDEADQFLKTQTISFVTTDEPGMTHHHYPSPNCTFSFTLGIGCSMGLDKCAIYTYPWIITHTELSQLK